MSDRAPCVRCGILLHTGEGRVLMSFTVEDLVGIVRDTADPSIQDRALCAIGLVDQETERMLRRELVE